MTYKIGEQAGGDQHTNVIVETVNSLASTSQVLTRNIQQALNLVGQQQIANQVQNVNNFIQTGNQIVQGVNNWIQEPLNILSGKYFSHKCTNIFVPVHS